MNIYSLIIGTSYLSIFVVVKSIRTLTEAHTSVLNEEFYVSLWDQESKNAKGHIWDIVPVRGKEVRVTPRIICEFYNAPYYEKYFISETNLKYFWDIDMDNIINFLTEGRGKRKYRP
ncbi:hypothetical protein J1N35_000964, partial [Gossypium stocksii]